MVTFVRQILVSTKKTKFDRYTLDISGDGVDRQTDRQTRADTISLFYFISPVYRPPSPKS
jgi:hypothetical protein